MDYSTPIKKNLWTNKITNEADARLFICHLLLDIGIIPIHAKLSDFGTEENPVFTDEGLLAYDNILNQLYIMPNGDPHLIVSQITDEAIKWVDVDNNDPIKRFDIINHSTGKVVYVAEFKSDFPLISVLYSVNNSDRNKKYKKVGYGTVVALQNIHEDWDSVCGGKPYCIDHIYKLYDNEAKKYFTGILGQENEGIFSLVIGFDDKWQKKVNENSK